MRNYWGRADLSSSLKKGCSSAFCAEILSPGIYARSFCNGDKQKKKKKEEEVNCQMGAWEVGHNTASLT